MKKLTEPFVIMKVGIEDFDGYDDDLIQLFSRLKAETKKIKGNYTLFGYHKTPTREYFIDEINNRKTIDIIFIPTRKDEINLTGWEKDKYKYYKLKKNRDTQSWNKMDDVNGETQIPKEINIWSAKEEVQYYGLVIKNITLYSQGKYKINFSDYEHYITGVTLTKHHARNPTLVQKRKSKKKIKTLEYNVISTAKLIYPYTTRLFKK